MLVPAAQFTGGGRNAVRPIPSTSSSKEDLKKKLRPLKQSEKEQQEQLEQLVDRAQLDAGKEALRQLLKERKSKKKKKTSCASLLKLYLTILAGLMIIGGLFTLLFLVPMTIDPALATLTYEFQPTPALCMTTFAEVVVGLKNISWCSCTEGCTRDVYNCSQITVVYRNCTVKNDSESDINAVENECDLGVNSTLADDDAQNNTTYIDAAHWDVLNGSLFINVKGCGYPPAVNCSIFYQYFGKPGRRFWCYYSKLDPYLVMPEYDPQAAEFELVQSLGWTIGAQIGGLLIIVLLHCPYMAFIKKSCRRSPTLPPKSVKGNNSSSSTTNLVGAWKDKDKPRQPVFQRDWYDVHT
ncbi:protein tipE-like [Homarus americanus]|uniref:protein tipE-like n=1 Tax=Homarus americanus TaxID=6706 RepID=UPI001C44844C|nr:protein tipE-like [Homarus americanus]